MATKAKTMTDEDALRRAAEIQQELDERGKRCFEQIQEILRSERCDIGIRGQFQGNMMNVEWGVVAQPRK